MDSHNKNETTDVVQKQEPQKLTKNIGGTNYEVTIHFSETSTENIWDKILRIIKNEDTT